MLLEREHPRGSRKQMINYVITLCTLHVTSVESNFKAKDLVRELITGIVIAEILHLFKVSKYKARLQSWYKAQFK